MGSEDLFVSTKSLLYLVSCALNGVVPNKEAIESFDLERTYRLAKFHTLEAVSYSALEGFLSANPNSSLNLSEKTLKQWSSKREETVTKDVYFGFEREKLFAFFEEQGIWYLPMKGMILRSLYPIIGWRDFVDNDILFDGTWREDVHEFMLKNQYEEYYKNNKSKNFKIYVIISHTTSPPIGSELTATVGLLVKVIIP